MERDFYRDEFEQLLKDSTEDFKMYPSRKVWHSIYNDLHPDRKWPSFAVCLLLLTAILYVGVSNNNSINSASRKHNATLAMQNSVADGSLSSAGDQLEVQPSATKLPASNTVATQSSVSAINLQLPSSLLTENRSTDLVSTDLKGDVQENITNSSASNLVTGTDGRLNISIKPSQPSAVEIENNEKVSSAEVVISDKADLPNIESSTHLDVNTEAKLALPTATAFSEVKQAATKDTRDKEWIENYAFHNQPQKRKKLLEGYEGQFYLTPGIGYRVMFLSSDYKKINNSLVAANSAARYAEPTPLELNQQVGLTMEMGGAIAKNINKKLRVKAGLQLNITDYITYAKKLDHPGLTMLALTNGSNSTISFESRPATYANVPGENTSQLHNKTIQVSLPVGADYRILGSRALSWHVGGSVQPTYVADGYAYLVSADNNYFVEEQSMLRRWNLNGAVESFVSIKTKDGSRINLGPQFRYSFFSSYKNYYNYTEKPYSIGFKIGFSKSF